MPFYDPDTPDLTPEQLELLEQSKDRFFDATALSHIFERAGISKNG